MKSRISLKVGKKKLLLKLILALVVVNYIYLKIVQFLKEGECPVGKQKNPNMKLLNGASDWKVSADLKTSLQFSVHIIQIEKRSDRFKEDCPPHRIDCPLGRKPGGSTRAEEKPIRDTACRLRGKGLDMSCNSY